MIIKFIKRKKAFTLAELLIVIILIAVVATATLALLNPKKQMEKAWDGKRKAELASLNKVFEDFYNDKNCYPKPNEVCYKDKTSTSCPICGRSAQSPQIPQLPQLPCDPQSPQKNYLYQVDSTSCPSSYKVYAILREIGGGASYNYGIASGNINLEPYPTLAPTTAPGVTTTPTVNPQQAFYCSPTGCLPCEEGGNPTACYSFPPERFCNSGLKIYGDLYGCQGPPPPGGTGCPCE